MKNKTLRKMVGAAIALAAIWATFWTVHTYGMYCEEGSHVSEPNWMFLPIVLTGASLFFSGMYLLMGEKDL